MEAPFPPETPTDSSLLRQVGAAFGLNQANLGRLLGLSRAMMSQIKAGRRSLPVSAYVPLARMARALDSLPAVPTPLPPPDPAALALHGRACRAKAMQLVLEQRALAGRAAWAERRLAALPALTAAFTPPADADSSDPPRWLTSFAAEAREVLAANGPLAQSRVALRRAALLYEITLVDRLLAGGSLTELDAPDDLFESPGSQAPDTEPA